MNDQLLCMDYFGESFSEPFHSSILDETAPESGTAYPFTFIATRQTNRIIGQHPRGERTQFGIRDIASAESKQIQSPLRTRIKLYDFVCNSSSCYTFRCSAELNLFIVECQQTEVIQTFVLTPSSQERRSRGIFLLPAFSEFTFECLDLVRNRCELVRETLNRSLAGIQYSCSNLIRDIFCHVNILFNEYFSCSNSLFHSHLMSPSIWKKIKNLNIKRSALVA